MQIEFVNHASVVLRRGAVHLLCDPWLEGRAFNDGWELLAPTVFKPEDFASITHIWYSHEHPDHFSPRCLASIPEEVRARITVLVARSEDGKVARYCRGKGFAEVVELDPEWPVDLDTGFQVRVAPFTDGDSWLYVRTPEARILNLNDCQVNRAAQARELRESLGEVDVLLTQFGISAWNGSEGELERRRRGAQTMLERTLMQARELGARWVIPFASFVWFCHAENDYMNSQMIPVGDVEAALMERTAALPVVLFPGDRWVVGDPHRNTRSVERWEHARQGLAARDRVRATPVPLEELRELGDRYRARVLRKLGAWRLRLRLRRLVRRRERLERPHGVPAVLHEILLHADLRVRPARIFLSDHGCSVGYDLLHGLRQRSWAREDCDVELSSDSLAYAFRFLWGGETLQVNGRFQELRGDGRRPLFDSLRIAGAMNREEGAEARPI